MRIKADKALCQGHGVCELEAAELFAVREGNDGTYQTVEVLDPTPNESLRSKLEAAVRFCPNRVLRFEDE